MPYTAAEARERLLATLAEATDELGRALAALGEAFELLDEATAERLEQEIFRPAQIAYGRAQRAYAAFAARHGLDAREFPAAVPGAPSHGAMGFLGSAAEALARTDGMLAALQDSLLPVEVGDAELRAGLADVRSLIGGLDARVRALVRTVGR